MALQTSGAISLNDMHIEAGGTTGTQASLNDQDIRDMISKSSGATSSFNEYYGASSTLTLTCSHIGSNGTKYLGICDPGGFFGSNNSEIDGHKTNPSSIAGNLSSYFEDVVIGQDYTYGAGFFLILVYKSGQSGAGAGLSTITLTRAGGGYTNSSTLLDNRGVYGNWNSSSNGRLALFSEIDAKPGVASWYNSLVYNQPGSFGTTDPLTITLT